MAEHIPISRPGAVNMAIKLLNRGSVIAVPTDTVYGLACDATSLKAIQNLYSIKCRNENKPVAICLGDVSDIKLWARIKHLPRALLSNLVPGPVTLIFNSINTLDASLCCNGKIGIRIPDYNFVRDVANRLGRPLALTSANLSNEPSALRPVEFQSIWSKIPAVFNGDIININRSGSTIIYLSELGVYHIVREGISFKEIVNILNKFGLRNKYEYVIEESSVVIK